MINAVLLPEDVVSKFVPLERSPGWGVKSDPTFPIVSSVVAQHSWIKNVRHSCGGSTGFSPTSLFPRQN